MRVNLTSGSIFNGLLAIGAGLAIMLPDQRWVGGLIVLLGIAFLFFDAHFERGQFTASAPNSVPRRISQIWPRAVAMILLIISIFSAALLIQSKYEQWQENRATLTASVARTQVEQQLKTHPETIRKPDIFARKEDALPSIPYVRFEAKLPLKLAPRSFVELDTQRVVASIAKLNGIQAQSVADLYLGKWTNVEGDVHDISVMGDSIVVTLGSPTKISASLFFESAWRDKLLSVNSGDKLRAVGIIYAFGTDGTTYMHCELL